MQVLILAINGFSQIIMMLLVGRAICSWFARSGALAYKAFRFFSMLTEPIVAPCRRITSKFSTGMFDFSVLLAFFLVMIVRDLLIRALSYIA